MMWIAAVLRLSPRGHRRSRLRTGSFLTRPTRSDPFSSRSANWEDNMGADSNANWQFRSEGTVVHQNEKTYWFKRDNIAGEEVPPLHAVSLVEAIVGRQLSDWAHPARSRQRHRSRSAWPERLWSKDQAASRLHHRRCAGRPSARRTMRLKLVSAPNRFRCVAGRSKSKVEHGRWG